MDLGELITQSIIELEQSYKAPHSEDKAIPITMCCKCVRQSYYELTTPKAPSFEDVYRKLHGKLLHKELLRKLAEKLNGIVDYRIELELGEIKLIGYADLKTDNAIYELKTVSKLPESPHPSHELQLNAYIYGAKLNEGWLIYMHRESGRIKLFRLSFSQSLLDTLTAKAKTLYYALKDKQAPKVDVRLMKKLGYCYFCQYWQECFSGSKGNSNYKQTKLF